MDLTFDKRKKYINDFMGKIVYLCIAGIWHYLDSEWGRLLSNAKNLLHYSFIHVINSHVKINMDPDTLVYEGIK